MALDAIPSEVIELSDSFICEYPFINGTVEENTDAFIERIREVRRFVDRTGKPAFIAHPLRSPVNLRLIRGEIEPWITELEPVAEEKLSFDEVASFFGLRVDRIAEAAARWGVPLEINGNTEFRVRTSNLPAALKLYRKAYAIMCDHGASFVPGSDQHAFLRKSSGNRMGGYVPAEVFEYLGLGVNDIAYLRELPIPESVLMK